jgi:chromosome segregation ATPase
MAMGPQLSNVDLTDLAGRVSSLEEELRERLQELQERHRDVRALELQVAVRDAFVVQLREEKNTLRGEAEARRVQLEEANEDRQARLEQVQTLDRLLVEANEDRQARLEQVQTLGRMLMESNEDRQARLEQVQTLDRMLMDATQDRQARIEQAQTLERMLTEAAQERRARLAQVQTSERMVIELEAQLAKTSLALQALQGYSGSAGFRLVNSVSARLRSWPRLYRPLRALVRQLARGRSAG